MSEINASPRGKQFKINGSIVNVPADVANTVTTLPRLPNETSTIKVNLKRRLQYKSSALFSETRFMSLDNDMMYNIDNYSLFRYDSHSMSSRPFGGMAVFSRVEFLPGYPRYHNVNGIEMTMMKVMILPHVTIIGIYRSPRIPVQQLYAALNEVLKMYFSI